MRHKTSIIFLTVICSLFFGCATTQPTGSTTNPDQDTALAKVEATLPYIHNAASVAVQLALQYAEKNPEKRDEIRMQVHTVSLNLQLLLDDGQIDAPAVTFALKVKEGYVNDILSTVAILYRTNKEQLAKDNRIDLAVKILEAVASGVKEGTGK